VADLEAGLREARTAIREETERIARSTILAPFDGTVIAKHAELEGHVSPGTPIVEIVSRGQVDARFMVPESAINMVRARGVLLEIRRDMAGRPNRGKPFTERIARAQRDRRLRTSAKQKRQWPRRKDHKPPHPPLLLRMTDQQKTFIHNSLQAA